MSKLRKVAEVNLDGKTYALGKNGNYALVDETATDAWGNPVGELVPLDSFSTAMGVQALLDALGSTIEALQSMKLERERRMGGGAE